MSSLLDDLPGPSTSTLPKKEKKPKPKKVVAGSNWAALQKTLPSTGHKKRKRDEERPQPSKAPEVFSAAGPSNPGGKPEADFTRGKSAFFKEQAQIQAESHVPAAAVEGAPEWKGSQNVRALREMVLGDMDLTGTTKADPGLHLAIDCEMVGVGPETTESSLARVSIVNWHGAVVLDTFVKQKEKVTDYRTWVSGVTPEDLKGAPTFEETQKMVTDLIDDKILIGHAIQNDFKALLLSHPRQLVRDTQTCPSLRAALPKSGKRPGLKALALKELGVEIQGGRHSSVIDARATMALYRLHKSEWEKTLYSKFKMPLSKTQLSKSKTAAGGTSSYLNNSESEDDEDGVDNRPAKKGKKEQQSFPGGGRKGVSSGLGLIIKDRKTGKIISKGRGDPSVAIAKGGDAGGSNWWEE